MNNTAGSTENHFIKIKESNNEEKLIVLLNIFKLDKKQIQQCKNLLPQINWNRFIGLVHTNETAPNTWANLNKYKFMDNIPKTARANLKKSLEPAAKKIASVNSKRRKWGAVFFDAIGKEKIEIIILKGFLFAEVIYKNPNYKKMNDIDMLIKREDSERIQGIMEKLNFVPLDLGYEDSPMSHQLSPHINEDFSCLLSPQFNLRSPLSSWKPDIEGIWQNKSGARVADKNVYRMSWEENLLHLCIDYPFFKIGVRELADPLNIILFTEIDWEKFNLLVKNWRAEDAAFRIISLCKALHDFNMPEDLLSKWREKTSRFCLKDTQKRLGGLDIILRSRSTFISEIEKKFVEISLNDNSFTKFKLFLSAIKLLCWPPLDELQRLAVYGHKKSGFLQNGLSRLTVPFKIIKGMSRDYGLSGLIKYFFKYIFIIIKQAIIKPQKIKQKDIKKSEAIEKLRAMKFE